MLQESLDRPLPEAQWAVLQLHLETCADCRKHRGNLQELERDLHRDLVARWEGVPGPVELSARGVGARLARRRKARRGALTGALAALALLFFWAAGGFDRAAGLLAPAESRGISGTAPAVSLETGAEPPGEDLPAFSAQVLLAAGPDGRSDLYLVDPDGSVENLTGGPGAQAADDTAPAWSPDGAWVAYLSTLNGKREVYVLGLDRREPVQLTHAPGIEWTGPLSWSPDGRWIALTGIRREQGSQSWIYLVPLDPREGARALAGTRGGWGPEYSPSGSQIAFFTGAGDMGSVAVYTFSDGDGFATVKGDIHWLGPGERQGHRVVPGVVTFPNHRLESFRPGVEDTPSRRVYQSGLGLDWSPDGRGLVYISQTVQGDGAQLTIQRLLDYSDSLYSDYQFSSVPAESRWPVGFGAVTWTTGGAVAYLYDPSDARANPDPQKAHTCWEIESRPVSARRSRDPRAFFGGLCVESGLDRSNWSPDGRWLVFVGRNAGDSQRSLYAVRMAGVTFEQQQGLGAEVLLSDAADLFGPGVVPRVRPDGPSLGIDPRQVAIEQAGAAPSGIQDAPGEVVFSVRNNSVTVIVSASPDGKRGRVLTSSAGNNRCPRLSPDGSQVAFISDDPGEVGSSGEGLGVGGGDAPAPVQEVYLMPARGGPPVQLSNSRYLSGAGETPRGTWLPVYGCPAWSPDGQYVAAPVNAVDGSFVAVLPLPAQRAAGAREHYLRLDGSLHGLAWMGDGRGLVLIQNESQRTLAEVLVARLPALAGGDLAVERHNLPGALGAVAGLAVDYAGDQIYLFDTQTTGSATALAFLRWFSLESGGEGMSLALGQNSRLRIDNEYGLAWLGENSLGIILHGQSEAQNKSHLLRFNTARGSLESLAEFEDVITSAAWTRDGSWVIFSAESGLWALDASLARRGLASPVWISPQPVDDLDWR